MDRQINRQLNGQIEEQIYVCYFNRMDIKMSNEIDMQINRQLNGQIDEQKVKRIDGSRAVDGKRFF